MKTSRGTGEFAETAVGRREGASAMVEARKQ